MSDIIDLANEQAERTLAHERLAAHQPTPPAATGVCFNCGAPLADGRRWCDADCRDDWDYFDALLRARGR